MSAIDIQKPQRTIDTSKEEINTWFYYGKKITLFFDREKTYPETESFDSKTNERKTEPLPDLDKISYISGINFASIDQYIGYLRRCIPTIDDEGNYEYIAYKPILNLDDSIKKFKITLLSEENNLIWKVFDRSSNTSHLVPFDRTFVFNDRMHVSYNAGQLGGYSSIFKTKNQAKDFLSIASFNYNKKNRDQIFSYFKDCVIENVETDKEDRNKITAIFLKKIIAPSKLELADPGSRYIVDSDNWLITLGAIQKCNDKIPIDNHGSIIIEGIDRAKYFMIMLDMSHVSDEDLKKINKDFKVPIGEVRISSLTKKKFKSSKYVKSWQISTVEARKLINLVSWEIQQQKAGKPQVFFDILGSGATKESRIRPFVPIKKLESYEAVKQTIIDYFKEKKKIMNQNKRFIVLIIRTKAGFIQTISFPETSLWQRLSNKDYCDDDDEDLQVIENENFKNYLPQHTELVFELVEDHWEQKIVPDNCITWAIKKLREIGLFVDKKTITSPKRTLNRNNPVYSLDSMLRAAIEGQKISPTLPMQQESDTIFKNVPPILLVLFREALLEKDFDIINFIVETLGSMGLFQAAYELLTLSRIEFGNNPIIDEMQQNLTDLASRADHKMFLLTGLLQNQADQLEKYIEEDPDNPIFSLFKSFLSLQKETLDLLEKKKYLTLVMNSVKEAFQKLSQATDLLQKNYTDLQDDLLNEKSFTEALFLNLSSDFKNQKDGDTIVERLKM